MPRATRDLSVQSPYLSGRDVQAVQRGINMRAQYISAVDIKVTEDGQYGPSTHAAAGDVAWYIGLRKSHIGPVLKTYAQDRIINPSLRNVVEKAREKKRKSEKPPLNERAARVALSLVGVMEQGGNNVGPMVSRIIRENGGGGPEPWCGDFVAYCYRHAGSKRVSRSWAAVRLLRGLLGINATSHPAPGDLVRYRFDHVGIFRRWVDPNTIETVEGNTGPSGAVSDSSTGGDGVYIKHRNISLVSDFLHVNG